MILPPAFKEKATATKTHAFRQVGDSHFFSVQNVSKSFGSIQAVRDVSFEIERGEVIGFLGPNGAGKTTLMRLLTGFFQPSSGRILVDGKDLFKSGLQIRKRIGYLAEHNPLYRDMTARDFLSYVASLKGVPARDRKKEIQEIAGQCGILAVLDRIIGKLSKGYQQRIGLAQAIAGKPDFLILDEPTSGLDPQQVAQIRALIQDLGRDRTILLSSHVLPEIAMTCRRVLIMNEGRLVASGTPQDLSKQLGLGPGKWDLEKIFLKIVTSEPAPQKEVASC